MSVTMFLVSVLTEGTPLVAILELPETRVPVLNEVVVLTGHHSFPTKVAVVPVIEEVQLLMMLLCQGVLSPEDGIHL